MPPNLTAMDFVNGNTGWVAGTGARGSTTTILRTANGGQSWAASTLSATNVLALGFADGLHGWAVATQGCNAPSGCTEVSILDTTDGGRSWQEQWHEAMPASLNTLTGQLEAHIQAFGTARALATVGETVLSTATGGKNWTPLAFPASFTPIGSSFISARQGWVVGSVGARGGHHRVEVLATTDAGGAWHVQKQISASGGLDTGVGFVDAKDGWLYVKDFATDRGTLYRTVDGGARWSVERGEFINGRLVVGPPTFVTPTVGWVAVDAGAAPFAGMVYTTTDGGTSWRSVTHQTWSIRQISLTSATDGWALSDRPQSRNFLIHTTDGGSTWTQVLPALAPSNDISFVSNTVGYGLGLPSNTQAILATTDAGLRWHQIATLPAHLQARSLSFADSQHGWVLGTTSGSPVQMELLATTDGGRNWTVAHTPPLPPGRVLPFHPYLHLFGSGAGLMQVEGFPATLLDTTTNEGSKWTQQFSLPRPPGTWTEMAFTDLRHGLMALSGKGGPQVSATADGGANWSVIRRLPGDTTVQGLAFANPSDGWMLVQVGYQSEQLWRTVDGGKTWATAALAAPARSLPLMPLGNSVRLVFTNSQDGWLLGGNAFLRTTDAGRTWSQLP